MSLESSIIKSRNRKLTADLKKSCKSDRVSSPQTRVCHSAIFNDSQGLAEQILSHLGSSSLESPKGSHEVAHRLSLSLSYRPPVFHRRTSTDHRCRRRRTAQLYSTSGSDVLTPPTGPADALSVDSLTPSSWTSGRVSQLAGRVKSLLIQVPDPSASFNAIQNSNLKALSGLDSVLKKDATFDYNTGCFPDNITHSHSSKRSPWYRHCRPGAPEPPVTPTCRQCVGALKNASIEPADSTDLIKHTYPNDSHRANATGKLDLSALEMDSDQENRYWSPEFFLPSPPPLGDALVGFGDRPFPSPPLIADYSEPSARQPPTIKLNLVPLAPISNLSQRSLAFETRHPKWLVGCRNSTRGSHRFTSLTRESTRIADESDSDSPASLVSSPPPKIVEHLPSLHESSWLIRPEAPVDKTESAIFTTAIDLPSATTAAYQPERGTPDGAEQHQTEQWEPSIGKESRNSKVVLPAASKRVPVSRPTVFYYSPKKSRTHSLVPSEHSAFLPVGSTHARVSSPCIH
ncbi:unnamed protein product [Dicrocoelium dendriticum]|nr:unnamed protein product [Dicrocoelium dendriticum]